MSSSGLSQGITSKMTIKNINIVCIYETQWHTTININRYFDTVYNSKQSYSCNIKSSLMLKQMFIIRTLFSFILSKNLDTVKKK